MHVRRDLGPPMDEPEPERSPLEVGSGFLGDHQVVEALMRGEEPILTYTVLKTSTGECHVIYTGHSDDDPALRFGHAILLDSLRRQIDRVDGEGQAAKLLFMMATDPDNVVHEGDDDTGGENPPEPPAAEQIVR